MKLVSRCKLRGRARLAVADEAHELTEAAAPECCDLVTSWTSRQEHDETACRLAVALGVAVDDVVVVAGAVDGDGGRACAQHQPVVVDGGWACAGDVGSPVVSVGDADVQHGSAGVGLTATFEPLLPGQSSRTTQSRQGKVY